MAFGLSDDQELFRTTCRRALPSGRLSSGCAS